MSAGLMWTLGLVKGHVRCLYTGQVRCQLTDVELGIGEGTGQMSVYRTG